MTVARTAAARGTSKTRAAGTQPKSPSLLPGRWLLSFLLLQMTCQVLLLVPSLGALRVFIRTSAFAMSLGLLFWTRPSGKRHPATWLAAAALGIVCLSFFNPTTNSTTAGVAAILLYIAILAPLQWVRGIVVDVALLRRMLLLLWGFHSLGAMVGMLQVYFPGRFDPVAASVLSEDYVAGLQITLANGDRVLRPMGLTDTPGGAGASGFYSVLIGVGFMLDRPRWWFRIVLVATTAVGMFAMYLSEIRALVVALAICGATIALLLGIRGKLGRFAALGVGLGLPVLGGAYLALNVGGDAVAHRFSSLMSTNARQVYYQNRGVFLESTLNDLLPQFPLGAGLGRYGMIATYFAELSSRDRMPIYAEIQWTAWLLDGGVPLMVAYGGAIVLALVFAARVALQRVGREVESLWLWALVIAGHGVGMAALTFNSSLFTGTMGVEFWLLNATLFAAAQHRPASSKDETAASPGASGDSSGRGRPPIRRWRLPALR